MATIANGAQHSLWFVEEFGYADTVETEGVDTFSLFLCRILEQLFRLARTELNQKN